MPEKEGACEECHGSSCALLIHNAAVAEEGVRSVTLDVEQAHLILEYDPGVVSEAHIATVADRIAGPIHERQSTCSLRIGRSGGRACESCALGLERQIKHLNGVRNANVSFRNGLLQFTYDDKVTSEEQLVREIRRLGITEVRDRKEDAAEKGGALAWIGARLEAIFTAVTFVTMIAGWLLQRVEVAWQIPAVLYAVAYVTGGWFGLKAGLESLRHRTIDIDLLMILAALGALVVNRPFEGAMLLFLFSLSNVLQDYAMGRTRNAIRALMQLRPDSALVRRGEELVTLPIESVRVGDVCVLKPGDRVPLDGTVLTGESALDQASVTGESMPVSKGPGDLVFAGTINQHGSLEIKVTRLANDSTIARLIHMVEEAQSQKAETQRFIDRAEQWYAAGVIVMTLLAIAIPLAFLSEGFHTAFYRAMTLMVAASPCALVISTPATILSAIGNGARRGVLFKGGAFVEQAATIRAIAFDKTGTLTEGKPHVTDLFLLDSTLKDETEMLTLAATAQVRSEHILGRAIVEAATQRGLVIQEPSAFQAIAGKGVHATIGDLKIHIGNRRYFQEIPSEGFDQAREKVVELQEDGKTSVIMAIERAGITRAVGVIAYADTLRPGVADVVKDLKQQGVEHIIMLTGDNHQVAQRIAREAGLDEFYAELLPEDKMQVLHELKEKYGQVAMVGDGVNDAPALASASLGIAMGAAGTDVALETADVVLMSDNLGNIPYLVALSHKTRRTLVANLGFAFAMILFMVTTILVTGLELPLAVIGHEGSTVVVSLNGLRLLAFRRR